jgi:hypothetical protein
VKIDRRTMTIAVCKKISAIRDEMFDVYVPFFSNEENKLAKKKMPIYSIEESTKKVLLIL